MREKEKSNLDRIRAFLFAPAQPLWLYCLSAFVLALLPSVALLASAYGVLVLCGGDASTLLPAESTTRFVDAFGTAVIAPVVETFFLAAGLKILSGFISDKALAALTSAIVWGAFHALFGLLWFFGTAWSFFVFSCAYLAWRGASFRKAYIAAALPHALVNLSVLSLQVLIG